jgi:DNA-binding NarL/FixJ family response regulator
VQPEVAKELAYHAADEVLTNREVEVLKLIADGCSNKLVADRLRICEDTAKVIFGMMLQKLKGNDRTHAVTIALHRGVLRSDTLYVCWALKNSGFVSAN